MTTYQPYRDFCAQRQRVNQSRAFSETLPLPDGRALRDGVSFINFSSNDYLGLSHHPLLKERARDFMDCYGAGATASRLVSGNLPPYASLEAKLAAAKGQAAALLLSSGYQTNISVLAALADRGVLKQPLTVLADRLSHYSLLQGALLGQARLVRFRHNDVGHLEQLLCFEQEQDRRCLIVTESVFGMDGDQADLPLLIALARRYNAMLYVDEAHATGLFGREGFGLAADYNGSIDVVMGTCGKALGGFGSYIACDVSLREYLIQRCGGLIYSTGLPPAVLGTIDAAIELVPSLSKERHFLQQQAARLCTSLRQQGWNCGMSTTHIIPVILGDEQAATALATTLATHGILAPAIRPPTVPPGTSRLRLSLSAAHKKEDIDHLIAVLARYATDNPALVSRHLAVS